MNILRDHTRENLMGALAIVENFGIVRVLLVVGDAKQKFSMFERIIMKGIKQQSNTLLNGGIGRVHESFIQQPQKT